MARLLEGLSAVLAYPCCYVHQQCSLLLICPKVPDQVLQTAGCVPAMVLGELALDDELRIEC